MSNTKVLLNRMAGTWGIEEDVEAFQQLFDVYDVKVVVADAAANTNTANTKLWSNPFDYPLILVKAEVNPSAAVTAHADNHATLTLLRDDGADGTPAACAVQDSDADNGVTWVADTDRAYTLTPANCVIAAGANIFHSTLKGGTGVQLPEYALKFRLRRA